jgi:formate dehydrogenase maturation protein FdhE
VIPNPYGPGYEDWGYSPGEADVLTEDTRELCPECGQGHIIYDGVEEGYTLAHCSSSFCRWTS